MVQRRGRPAAGQQTLTREHILATALRLVDEHGIEGLSMRRLAGELGVDPMAIYHHVPGKSALLAGITAMVFNDLQVPRDEGLPWQEQVRAFAAAYRAVVRAHPRLVLHLVSDLESAMDSMLDANERLYSALKAAGLSPPKIVQAGDVVVDYLHGYALAEGLAHQVSMETSYDWSQVLDGYPPDRFPVQREIFSALYGREQSRGFDAGLSIILAGIELLARS